MSKKISTASRAHRTLRHLPQFQMAQDSLTSLVDSGLVLNPNERFIGAYLNHPDEIDETIVVTDTSLHVRSGGNWIRVDYDDMESATSPEEKNKAAEIHILCKHHGASIVVPVRGSQGRTRDIFEFLRFLDRTIGDRK